MTDLDRALQRARNEMIAQRYGAVAETCTCDGTLPGLPPRRTVSGHHTTCPTDIQASRKYNREHRKRTGEHR